MARPDTTLRVVIRERRKRVNRIGWIIVIVATGVLGALAGFEWYFIWRMKWLLGL